MSGAASDNGSYYGNPIVKPPIWEEREIAGYLFLGGLAGGCSILAVGADASDLPGLARSTKLAATVAIGLSLGALIKDLGRPTRFLNMLRVFKPTSPMSVGVWILTGYAPLAAASAASEVSGVAPRAGRLAGAAAGLMGAPVASYTAALVSNTAVPLWHEGRRELPFLFVGSAASAAGGLGLLAAPRRENAPAARMAALGAVAELLAEWRMEGRLGALAEPLHEGEAGRRLKLAKALSAAGAGGALALSRRSRLAAALSGCALLAGSALTRFGLFEAGMESARDPRYTVESQRPDHTLS